MPEITERDPKAGRTSELPENDPLISSSLSGPILISTLLLMVTVGWSLWDEVYGQRPWKGYQQTFVERYRSYLTKTKSRQSANAEKEVMQSAEYQQLDQAVKDAEAKTKQRRDEINAETALLTMQIKAVRDPYQEVRGRVGVENYEAEVTHSDGSKQSHLRKAERLKGETHKFDFPVDRSGKTEKREMKFQEMEALFNELKDRKAQLTSELIELTKPENELKQKRDAYLQERLPDLSPSQIDGLVRKMDNFSYEIKQINLPEGQMVDRCESCHVGIREPLVLTKASMGVGGKEDAYARAFTSHPDRELLKIHNPDRFGCSTCHNGNGRATTSVTKAHGHYEYWLWPLYKRENMEAGCQQCHSKDMVLDHANTLSEGKNLFQQKGCYACHRYEGYDRESEGLFNLRQAIKQFEAEKTENRRQSEQAKEQAGDPNLSNEQARTLLARSQNLVVTNSQLDAKIEQLDNKAKYLMWDRKMFGPNLKEIRYKLRKEWVPVWLKDPHKWRPGTKMPQFRLEDDEIRAISAYLWQSALQGLPPLAPQPQGDAARGKTLFQTRGCLACHSVGEGNQRLGGTFAANLTRVGEKANYEYIVRWIHNPRERLAPYSPSEKKDLMPEDYQQKGLKFEFGRDQSKSPNTGREIQWQNNSVMPNLRLSDQDTRDIATYLFSLRRNESYPDASFMDDPKLKDRGVALIRNYGCASCHEIKGLEEEQRIGTELTVEGSKPIERLDFALLQHDAKKGIDVDGKRGEEWYNHKGFFEHKLADPAVYDQGKIKEKKDKLKMPKIAFGPDDERKAEEIAALTTFLLGSVDSAVPATMRYNPADQRQAIQEGWWVIRKYNCLGCHNIQVGQRSVLETLPAYQGEEKEKLPPRLTSEGARVNPDWLLRFLNDPSLSGAEGTTNLDQNGKANRNGVRPYLDVRMPTFNFSPNELRTLVNFFMAASAQAQPHIAEKLDALSEQERGMARALFTSQASPCLKCHITDNNNVAGKTAPNLLIVNERLKPAWTLRWILDPAQISPGVNMPSGLFKRDESHARWVFGGPVPESFKTYDKDHAELMVRYMFQLTPDEQRRLGPGGGSSATKTARGPMATKDKQASRQRSPGVAQAATARRLVAVAH